MGNERWRENASWWRWRWRWRWRLLVLKCVGLCLLTSRHFRFLSPHISSCGCSRSSSSSSIKLQYPRQRHRHQQRLPSISKAGWLHFSLWMCTLRVCVCARLMYFSLLCGCEYLNTLVSLKMSSRCCPTLPCPDPHCKLFAYRWLLSQWLVTAAV